MGQGQCLQHPVRLGTQSGLQEECRPRRRQGQGLRAGAGQEPPTHTHTHTPTHTPLLDWCASWTFSLCLPTECGQADEGDPSVYHEAGVCLHGLHYPKYVFEKEQLSFSFSRWTRWKSLNTAEAPQTHFMQSTTPGPVPLSLGTTSGGTCRWTPPHFSCSSSPRWPRLVSAGVCVSHQTWIELSDFAGALARPPYHLHPGRSGPGAEPHVLHRGGLQSGCECLFTFTQPARTP